MGRQGLIGDTGLLPQKYLIPTKAMFCALLIMSVGAISSCNSSKTSYKNSGTAHVNNKTKFSSKVFGVKGSPRITTSKRVRKGGGRYQIGKPYKIRGKWYKPKLEPKYEKTGMASWYGPNFHGRLTANGEIYDQYSLSAAHPTMPLPSYARVTNLSNGRSVVVRVNDRGPYAHGRLIDLSAKAAKLLDYTRKGVARVRVKYLGKARMDGRDHRKLLASYNPGKSGGSKGRGFKMPGTALGGTMFAKRKTNDNSFLTAFAKVPVPEQRPSLHRLLDGVPIIISLNQIEYATLKPLAYSNSAIIPKSKSFF